MIVYGYSAQVRFRQSNAVVETGTMTGKISANDESTARDRALEHVRARCREICYSRGYDAFVIASLTVAPQMVTARLAGLAHRFASTIERF